MKSQLSVRCRRAALGLGLAALTLLSSNHTTRAADPPPVQYAGNQAGPGGVFDVLPDGRIIGLAGNDVLLETAVHSGAFNVAGSFAEGLISQFGASFFSINPAGTHVIVGDGNFGAASVLGFAVSDLNGGQLAPDIYAHENYAAAWMDDDNIAISYGDPNTFLGSVNILDRNTGIATQIMTIGGASAGIGFTSDGSLLTGNGYDLVGGGSQTGEVHGFTAARIMEVLNGQTGPIDFETEGQIIATRLSAGGLHLDSRGDLFIGGGVYGTNNLNYFALLDGPAVFDALQGNGPVSEDDMFFDDPAPGNLSIYSARFNAFTGQWLVYEGASDLLWRYRLIPAPGTATALLLISLTPVTCRRRRPHARIEVPA